MKFKPLNKLKPFKNLLQLLYSSFSSDSSINHLLTSFLLFLLIILPFSPTLAQSPKPQLPVFLEQLDIEFDAKTNVSIKRYQSQYQKRVYTTKIIKQIEKQLLADLKTRGFYFAKVDYKSVKIDSTTRTVFLSLKIKTGGLTRLNSVVIDNLDSLSFEHQNAIEKIIQDYLNQYYTESIVKSMFGNITGIFENSGYPLAKIHTRDFDFREANENDWLLDLHLEISTGDLVKIAYLSFPRQKNNLTSYLQRLLRFNPGQPYEDQRVTKYQAILRRQEFLKDVKAPVLALDKSGKYFLSIEFEETPSTAFDGIVGYIPPPANDAAAKGYFTGLINVGIRNLFGGGRKLLVLWQKQDRFSEEFRLGYREPFVFGLPFHSQVGLNRLVRDTTFIEWQYNFKIELPLSDALRAFVDFSSRSVFPDSLASRKLRLPKTASFTTETGIGWDNRDNIRNPRKGVNLEIAFSLSSQKNNGPDYLIAEDSLLKSVTIQKMRVNLNVFVPTFKRQVIANHLHLEFIENRGEVLRTPDQVWFGGATSVRGFREDQFFARRVFWTNSEYRFILAPQARVFVFTDNAFFSRQFPDKVEKWLTSYGMGLRITGPLGIVQIDFGLEKGAPFREGKLHFRIINEF